LRTRRRRLRRHTDRLLLLAFALDGPPVVIARLDWVGVTDVVEAARKSRLELAIEEERPAVLELALGTTPGARIEITRRQRICGAPGANKGLGEKPERKLGLGWWETRTAVFLLVILHLHPLLAGFLHRGKMPDALASRSSGLGE